jgi:hypothetical protein
MTGPQNFDEVMIVSYKTRFQLIKMVLLTPNYWPLRYWIN